MATTIYKVSVGDEIRMVFSADFAQASSPLMIRDLNGEAPDSTPFQVADAHHRPVEAAELLNTWLRSQYGAPFGADEEWDLEEWDLDTI